MFKMEEGQQDICRVCRSEGSMEKPLYHPCVCTGSIKFIHQECLVQWLRYSKKEYCELCKHKFAFTPIYSPDMPRSLPIKDIVTGLFRSVGRAIRYWFHYTLVAVAWLGVVPLTACRIYRCLFTGSVSSLLTLPLDMLSTDNLVSDCFQGCFVVTCTLCAFISLVWLREQILHGGGPDWLEENFNLRLHIANVANNAAPEPAPNAANDNPDGPPNDNAPPNIPANPVEEDDDDADNDAAANGVNNVAQDDNWNPIEWDRAAEELTWERLLGLDGSLVFLEHVFWVVSLNTLFILVFAFCPYHIGHFTIVGLKAEKSVGNTQFEGLLTTLIGYFLIAVSLVLLHGVASVIRQRRFKRLLGLCYIVVKVSLLVVVEIGIFPLVCGWWLDICSLSMFDSSLKDRETSFILAPGTSMFIHWLVGMVYVFYFASFILLLREVLRPGVLWFLRNLNDPDFNPIQEMIHLPIYRHVRRFLASMVIFGSTVLVMLWLPVRVIRNILPGFLPYNVMLSSDAPVSELSLELLLLQVVLPALLEQGHTRNWLKSVVRGWCVGAAWMLDLRSYLLGDVPLNDDAVGPEDVVEPRPPVPNAQPNADAPGQGDADPEPANPAANEDVAQPDVDPAVDNLPANEEPGPGLLGDELNEVFHQENQDGLHVLGAGEAMADEDAVPDAGVLPPPLPPPPPPPPQPQGLGAAHQAMLQGGAPTGFQPFNKPEMFQFKLVSLMGLMCVTLFFSSLVSYIVPVLLGRQLMGVWMGETKIHELYTAACGLYTCWVILRMGTVVYHWVPQGWRAILSRVSEWTLLALKSVVVAMVLIGLVPLLLGLLFELVIVAPLRVPLDQTPVFFPWQDWALGVLHAKIICAVTMMGPQWWLKRVIEQVYNQGLRNMDLMFILCRLCAPVVGALGFALSGPYIIARSVLPAAGCDFEMENLVVRRIYPFLLSVFMFIAFCVFQVKQFNRLYEHIKNDKYLVGQRLVNYERERRLQRLEGTFPPPPPMLR